MAQKKFNNPETSTQQAKGNALPPTWKKQSRALWIVILIFFVLVTTVFLTQRKDTINWVEDYEAGIELARQQNKPVLLAFYKLHTRFSSQMWQDTYNDPDVIEYVEANFVPILIDVDKQPEIAKRYKIDYYPTHYVKEPHSDKLFGPMLGYESPSQFIGKFKDLLKKMGLLGE